ncbi:MAG: SGNH/GDSL hydrolase family protein [Flavobacteriales bacterium]|nr:SGNH/GDSL hydrolase family protein [Flavobacteriales bacterium]MBP6696300.1 SGNH/GDSL hydrolase family protein [Flavobacteriales bacterium]
MQLRIGYALFLLLFTLLAAEVLLRSVDPFGIRVRGDHIELVANTDHTWENGTLPDIDARIHMHRNSLGFRGADPPTDTTGSLRIIAVGGSTTECQYLSDGQDWPALLADTITQHFDRSWTNNAGLDGHSTFGHAYLLHDLVLPLRPQVVLLLIGANEVGRHDIGWFDLEHINNGRERWTWTDHLELLNTWKALRNAAQAKQGHVMHEAISPGATFSLTLDSAIVTRALQRELPLVDRFGERLAGLVALCRTHGSDPILVTQPTLFSSATDPATGKDLGHFPLGDSLNGDLVARRLALYNARTRAIATATGAAVIDLDSLLPGNSTDFYDSYHFTRTGARHVAQRIAEALIPYLSAHYPQHLER